MIDKKINEYRPALAFGEDVIYKGLKIINNNIGELKTLMFQDTFLICKEIITQYEKFKRDIQSINYVLFNMIECENVEYNNVADIYLVYTTEKEKAKIVSLYEEDVETIFLLLQEMYWCQKVSDSEFIDESKAADEKALERIRKINENKKKFKKKSKANMTMFGIIEKCAALRLGGYDFKTIQDLTLYQLKCLMEAHDADIRYLGVFCGIYSQSDLSKIDLGELYWANEN